MQVGPMTIGIGWILALLVLVATFVIWIGDSALDKNKILLLISGLALARLLP